MNEKNKPERHSFELNFQMFCLKIDNCKITIVTFSYSVTVSVKFAIFFLHLRTDQL